MCLLLRACDVACRCVLELHAIAAKMGEGGGEFAVAMTAEERLRFLRGIQSNYKVYYEMLGTVNMETSDCSRPADRESIHDGIRGSIGFVLLSRMVFGVLEEWMEGQLRAQVAACMCSGDINHAMEWSGTLGTLFAEQGRQDEAIALLEEELEYNRRVLPANHPRIGANLHILAAEYRTVGRFHDAIAMGERALVLLPVTHPARLTAVANLAGTYRAVGRDADALPMAKSVLDSYLRVNDPDTGGAMNNLASNYFKLGMLDDALDMAKQALQFYSRTLPENHPDIGIAMGNLASIYSSLERHEDALALKERVLEHRRRVLPENHPAIGMAWYNLHTSYEKVGVYPRALECAKEALRIWQVSRPPGHEDILDAQKAIRKLST